MTTQLSLWAEPAPDTLELSFSWADRDTSREQLERLATLLPLGGLQAANDDTGRNHWFRVLATRIEDGHVVATCEETWPLGKRNNSIPDEDEEEDEEW